jgi:3-oxoacyl-[acyl-carrier-protein] synthase-3
MSETSDWDAARAVEWARKFVAHEMRPGAPLPDDEVDLVKGGHIDSMGWVGILTAIEEATTIKNFGNPWPDDRPKSIRALVAAIVDAASIRTKDALKETGSATGETGSAVSLVGWGHTFGSLSVGASTIERECGLPPGTLRDRAGIESVCRADSHENELTLGQRAAELALDAAHLDTEKVGVLVVTSATFLSFPSLAASLHNRLLLPEPCLALDVGGACVGVVYALATAKAMLSTSRNGVALVVASEVNSRRLTSPHVPGEFRGLFGDGACAFVLTRTNSESDGETLRLGEFVSGCSGAFASALQVRLGESGGVEIEFEGEQLAQAAISQLNRIMDALETLSSQPRSDADYFAIHEPNPRLVSVFAQRAGIPMDKLAHVTKAHGNLGSATCGISLCTALTKAQASRSAAHRPLIFVAAVGPGLLWGGTYVH